MAHQMECIPHPSTYFMYPSCYSLMGVVRYPSFFHYYFVYMRINVYSYSVTLVWSTATSLSSSCAADNLIMGNTVSQETLKAKI